jgi:hypothetical protein
MRSLKEKVAAPVCKTEINSRGGSVALTTRPLYPQKLAVKFADRWRSLSRYGLLVG